MKQFTANATQEKTFKKVVEAFKAARKTGLVFYAKSDKIVAYTKDADEYIEKDFEKSLCGDGGQVQYLSASGLISDAGADDYGRYLTDEDEQKYR